MSMTLGYWDIRGLAHAIRLLLEYTDSSYEEKKYTMGHAPDYDRSQWLNEKFKLGLDFPNLPYLIDGTHKITQSNAILRYVARKHNLCGETEEEKIRVDILENQAMDVSNQLARVCYSPDFEKLKPEYLEGLPTMMQHFSQFLGKRPWFVGDKVMGACDGDTRDLSYILCYGGSSPHILGLLQITFVDFLAYDVLDLHRIFEPKCLDAFPNLKDFISRFEGLEKISAYMKSSRFLPKPLYTRVAVWGNK
ncbi:PREDICTED: glutathione S-transferase Mu 4 isoform X1 [Cercocebus atys]|uniref:glutathione S-transferase Mu 4 isoform X1 n=1 Tax=Cercocebus atys TaxID=9531 RepID=UPI0005F4C79B|nr:PREDICTED: glutathione S-transferase Mu 4 isoform X1 [Cercocebus atys]